MNGSDALDLLHAAIALVVLASAPVVVAATVVGLVISIFQALTQVQEMTLTFVPKILAVLVVLMLSAPFVGAQISLFAEQVYARIETPTP